MRRHQECAELAEELLQYYAEKTKLVLCAPLFLDNSVSIQPLQEASWHKHCWWFVGSVRDASGVQHLDLKESLVPRSFFLRPLELSETDCTLIASILTKQLRMLAGM
jgi:hypothetical protein